MKKDTIIGFIVCCVVVIVLGTIPFTAPLKESSQGNRPKNVTVQSTPTSNYVFVEGKPGYKTSVSTTCVNGVCTNTSNTTPITTADKLKMKADMEIQQQAIENLMREQQQMIQFNMQLMNNLNAQFPF